MPTLNPLDWSTIVQFVDIPTLLALRQTSSSLHSLIDANDSLWRKFIPPFTPADFKHLPITTYIPVMDSPPEFQDMAIAIHRHSSLTPTKLKYIASYLPTAMWQDEGARDRIFANAYNEIFRIGYNGMICFLIPLLLYFFLFSLPLAVWIFICTFFTLLGGGLMIHSLWGHIIRINQFYKCIYKHVSWMKLYPFAMYSPLYQYLHPLRTFFMLGCTAWLSIIIFAPIGYLVIYLLSFSFRTFIIWWYYFLVSAFTLSYLFTFDIKTLPKAYWPYSSVVLLALENIDLNWRIFLFLLVFLIQPLFFYTKPQNYQLFDPPEIPYPDISSSIPIVLLSIVSATLPPLLVLPMAIHLPTTLGFYYYFSLFYLFLIVLVSATTLTFFSVYNLVCLGDYRWWWISFLAPTCATSIILLFLFPTLETHTLLLGVIAATAVGSFSHQFVCVFVIGYISGNSAQHPRLETMLHFTHSHTLWGFVVSFQRNFFTCTVGSKSGLFEHLKPKKSRT